MPRPNYSTGKTTGNHRTVNYTDIKGRNRTAEVTGGSGTSLNLRVPHITKANSIKTGIAKRTTLAQTNVWW